MGFELRDNIHDFHKIAPVTVAGNAKGKDYLLQLRAQEALERLG